MNRFFKATMITAMCAGAAAADHAHMTIDTDGTTTMIDAGYLPAEFDYGIDTGRLMHDGEIAIFDIGHDSTTQAGYTEGLALVLTSDFYNATGRLDGGNFMFELSDVVPISGSVAATAAWGAASGGHGGHGGDFAYSAFSDGATRMERSFHVGAGNHLHNQMVGFSTRESGVYDLTLQAWDMNGVFGDSSPVTIRIHVIPAPATLAMVGLFGLRRRR